jgi:large subunit ribosomal protein L5
MKENLKLWCKTAQQALQKELDIRNIMRVPKIEKIVINVGFKDAVSNSKVVTNGMALLADIVCQQPVKTLAKKSIAGFKLREGMPIGTYVTLRGIRMYAFLYKLIHIVLPKIRDFQGVSTKLDGQGNYNLGLVNLEVFPEGERSGVNEFSTGASITFVTSTRNDHEALACLKAFGMPFKKDQKIN